MPNQSWVALLNDPAPIVDGAAYNTATALTTISPSSSTAPDFVIPANYLQPGQVLRCTAWGRFGTTGTPTLNLGLYYGGIAGTALATTGAITTTSGVTNVPWRMVAEIIVRGIGTSGSLFTMGLVTGISGTVGVSSVPLPASAPAAVAVDTVTSAKALVVGATWGTNNAANTITCHGWLVEALN